MINVDQVNEALIYYGISVLVFTYDMKELQKKKIHKLFNSKIDYAIVENPT